MKKLSYQKTPLELSPSQGLKATKKKKKKGKISYILMAFFWFLKCLFIFSI